jgi:hypothetical protein
MGRVDVDFIGCDGDNATGHLAAVMRIAIRFVRAEEGAVSGYLEQ